VRGHVQVVDRAEQVRVRAGGVDGRAGGQGHRVRGAIGGEDAARGVDGKAGRGKGEGRRGRGRRPALHNRHPAPVGAGHGGRRVSQRAHGGCLRGGARGRGHRVPKRVQLVVQVRQKSAVNGPRAAARKLGEARAQGLAREAQCIHHRGRGERLRGGEEREASTHC